MSGEDGGGGPVWHGRQVTGRSQLLSAEGEKEVY